MNNNQPGEKGYLITFHDPQTSMQEASLILGTVLGDGVQMMATDTYVENSQPVHFTGLGISKTGMLDEQTVDRLRMNDAVLAVEEDDFTFALGFEADTLTAPSGNGYSTRVNEEAIYNNAYEQARQDLLQKIMQIVNGATTTSSPGTIANIPQNIALVKAPQAWARGIDGRGVKVAVLDSGISSHTDLTVEGGVCMVPGNTNFADDRGHGTHAAGIIAGRQNSATGNAGVAPGARLYAVKVLNQEGTGKISWILAGMEWALKNGMQVVSMSLGSDHAPLLAYTTALRRLANAGVSVVCATGNSYNKQGYPFTWVGAPANSHPSVIAVGAVDNNATIASFSSRGSNGPNWNGVSLTAPGVGINSTYHSPANSYKRMQGTSMACPHVSGAVALIRQRFPDFTVSQIKARLMKTAAELGSPGLDDVYGAGLLDCDAATR